VNALALSGSDIYVGGAFTAINGEACNHLAQLRPSTGQLSTWRPNPDASVNALAMSGSTLYAGGSFATMGGLPQARFASLIPLSLVDVPPAGPIAEVPLQLAPNPAASAVRLAYTLPEAALVRIGVYDVLGRRVAAPVDGLEPAGRHEATWDGRGGANRVAPGLYFVRLDAGARRAVRRVVIVR
jgi:hypothetical protein